MERVMERVMERALLFEREKLRSRKLFGRADAILNHLTSSGICVNDAKRKWSQASTSTSGSMPARYGTRRPDRILARSTKIYGRRLDDGDMEQTPEERAYFNLKGAQALREADLAFLSEKRGSLPPGEFQRYLNSIVMTDLKRNRRYTKALQTYLAFS
ncbi:hypothetical protein TrRE_jg3026, partial [Triparma retinervis]